jgi:hypothetical protein
MSKLAEYRQLERHLAEQMAAFEAMKGDQGLKQEIEFETKLRTLLGEYSKSLRDVIAIIGDPASQKPGKNSSASAKPTRKARSVKVYKNPNTGEVVETKGGNHKTLKQWKAEYGSDTVESWLS